jgi:anti-anti-sigma factor
VTTVELRTRICCGYAVVVLRGELDILDAENAAGAVAALVADGQQLIIDLEALDFIDCHAAGALLRVRAMARRDGGDVLLAAPHGPVLRLLTVLGVPGVYASVAAAASSASRRDARRAAGTARSGRAALSGTRSRVAAQRAAVPGPRAGGWPGTLRWLRARGGPQG